MFEFITSLLKWIQLCFDKVVPETTIIIQKYAGGNAAGGWFGNITREPPLSNKRITSSLFDSVQSPLGSVQFMCSPVMPFQTSEKLPFLLILKDFVDPVLYIKNYLKFPLRVRVDAVGLELWWPYRDAVDLWSRRKSGTDFKVHKTKKDFSLLSVDLNVNRKIAHLILHPFVQF